MSPRGTAIIAIAKLNGNGSEKGRGRRLAYVRLKTSVKDAAEKTTHILDLELAGAPVVLPM